MIMAAGEASIVSVCAVAGLLLMSSKPSTIGSERVIFTRGVRLIATAQAPPLMV